MGSDSDAPQPGFDRWVSFKGQGTYWPNPNGLNVDGRKVPQKGYITDELTDYAVEWLDAARYSDSYGYQSDLLMPTWPYRDWVVNAFNQNLPYDRFLIERKTRSDLPDDI